MAAFPHNLAGTQEVPKIWHLDQANQSHYPSPYVSQPPSCKPLNIEHASSLVLLCHGVWQSLPNKD
jgi:hypothetical protein